MEFCGWMNCDEFASERDEVRFTGNIFVVALTLAGVFALAFFARPVVGLAMDSGGDSPLPATPVARADDDASGEEIGPVKMHFGAGGLTRLGKWVPVFVRTDRMPVAPVTFSLTVPDCDSMMTTWSGELVPVDGKYSQALVRIGNPDGLFELELFGSSGELVAGREGRLDGVTEVVPSTVSPVLLVGGDEKLQRDFQEALQLLNREEPVVQVEHAEHLPASWLGYDSVGTVVLVADDGPVREVSARQWRALRKWQRCGGKVVVSTNGAAGEFGPDGPFADWEFGEFVETFEARSLPRLESLTNTRLEFDGIRVARIAGAEGTVVARAGDAPLIVRKVDGLGVGVFVALDLADDALSDWEGRSSLLARVLEPEELSRSAGGGGKTGTRVSNAGYDDLAGQLRGPLAKFTGLNAVNFTFVALMIGLFLVCVGPGDWFLLKRFLGRMELTWLTFTLMTLAFCAGAWLLGNWSRSKKIEINQIEIVDVDSLSGTVRGNGWFNVYSPATEKVDVAAKLPGDVGLEEPEVWLGWFGTPGDGLGGMMNRGLTATRGQYRQTIHRNGSEIEGLPLQVASTRAFHAQWAARFSGDVKSSLRTRNDRLIGSFINPFPFELKNVRIMFGSYTYSMQEPLPAGEPLDVASQMTERTSRSYLNGRTKLKEQTDRSRNEPWDPASTDTRRIADMLMFHDLAGGRSYTSLGNRFLDRIDMSEVVWCNRAILVGELERRFTEIEPASNAESNQDSALTVFRFVLPVENDN